MDFAARIEGIGFRARVRVNPRPEAGISKGRCVFGFRV